MDAEHRDFEHEEEMSAWRADLDQAQASAKDIAPIVATMYRELRNQGLGLHEAVFLAAAWVWNTSRPFPDDRNDPREGEE